MLLTESYFGKIFAKKGLVFKKKEVIKLIKQLYFLILIDKTRKFARLSSPVLDGRNVN